MTTTPRAKMIIWGPLAGIVVATAMAMFGWPREALITGGVTACVAIWWIFEAIPIPAASLVPLAAFGMLGVLSGDEIAHAYGNPLILLLLGGFILSTAMERSGTHRKVALGMMRVVGGESYRRVVFGFMLAAAVLSMWISNTATTLMLLPVAVAILDDAADERLAVPLLLGLCYAASVGGIGTPIGTPPNAIFMQVYAEYVGTTISFVTWMKWAVPVVIVFIPVIGWWLTRALPSGRPISVPDAGPWTAEQRRVVTVFAATALAWMTREQPFGGWSELLSLPGASDASVALTAVVVMFVVPNGRGGRLLDWETANRIPWGLLILFGGGIAIAKAFQATGISTSLGTTLSGLAGLPTLLLLLIVTLSVTFMTEVTSNTATTNLLMPVLAAGALGAGLEPALIMVPAAMSASCAFMLPVATAPNAVVFGSGRVTIRQMARHGLALNVIGAVLISTLAYVSLAID